MVTEFWAAITTLGDIRLWVIFVLFMAVWAQLPDASTKRRQRRRLIYFLVLTLVVTSLVAEGLKIAIGAPRICDPATNPFCPTDAGSFPSGHSALAWAMFTAVWFLRCSDRRWAVIFILPILVSLSRLALGVHAPLDVITGTILGAAITTVVWLLTRKRIFG